METPSKGEQSPPDPAFDGPKRYANALGDLGMRQAVDKGQHNAAPLLIVEQFEAALQGARFCRSIDLVYYVGFERCVAERRIIRQNLAAEPAHGIQRTKADDAGEPCGSTPRSAEKAAAFCQIWNEGLLQHVGSDLRPPHDTQCDAP